MKKIFLAIAALLFSVSVAQAETTAQFTSRIEDRQPVDSIESIVKDGNENITFFSDIQEQEGKVIAHVWKKDGVEEIYQRNFNINGARWRVWSTISTRYFEPGDKVTVDIIDTADNKVLLTKEINIK